MDFPGNNPGVGCHFLLQGIFLTHRSNPSLLLGRWILYHWATLGSPFTLHKTAKTSPTSYENLVSKQVPLWNLNCRLISETVGLCCSDVNRKWWLMKRQVGKFVRTLYSMCYFNKHWPISVSFGVKSITYKAPRTWRGIKCILHLVGEMGIDHS